MATGVAELFARVAVIAVWIVALAPFASVFSMAYPSSLLAGSTWAFVFLHDRQYLAAGAAATVATLARPNGIVLVVALAVAVWRNARSTERLPTRSILGRLAMVCGPGVVALSLWCMQLARWTCDPFVFWTAKQAWYEVSVVRLIQAWPGDAMLHVIIGLLAIAAIVLAWRQMPPAWLVFASLYLLPSFAVGLVGLGRYAGECLPAVIAGGVVLARVPRRIVPVVLTAAATAMAAVALAVTAEGIIP